MYLRCQLILGISSFVLFQSMTPVNSAEIREDISEKNETVINQMSLNGLTHQSIPVFDQGDINSGTACAISSSMISMHSQEAQDPGALRQYYATRVVYDTPSKSPVK